MAPVLTLSLPGHVVGCRAHHPDSQSPLSKKVVLRDLPELKFWDLLSVYCPNVWKVPARHELI